MEKQTFEWGGENREFVKVSSVPGFKEWLNGQTVPLVSDAENPMDWAYPWDYERFVSGKPALD